MENPSEKSLNQRHSEALAANLTRMTDEDIRQWVKRFAELAFDRNEFFRKAAGRKVEITELKL